jgi:1,4-alpha-glucan branching enzyme
MLYLDYSRKEGEWEPNIYGGRENLDTISFLKEFNEAVYSNYEGVQTIAEKVLSNGFKANGWFGFWNEMDDGLDA